MTDNREYRARYFILGGKDNHEVIESDFRSAEQWMEEADHHRVAFTVIGSVDVSTIFLGFDHNFRIFTADAKPRLFETMILPQEEEPGDPALGRLYGYQTRCATWAEAVAMHELACAIVEAAMAQAER